jgi:solute carrier family 10 (sodium/bile acid cotransporter), member 7
MDVYKKIKIPYSWDDSIERISALSFDSDDNPIQTLSVHILHSLWSFCKAKSFSKRRSVASWLCPVHERCAKSVMGTASSKSTAYAISVSEGPKQTKSRWHALCSKVGPWLLANHLPIFFSAALIFGYFLPAPGIAYSRLIPKNDVVSISNLNVATIFFFTGMKLKGQEVLAALKAWRASTYGLFTILILTSLFSFALVQIPFSTPEVSYGAAIFFLGPTTVSSGAILVGQAKGNVPMALLLTVLSNLLCCLTLPVTVSLCFGSVEGISVEIDVLSLLGKLCLFILLPMLLGKSLSSATCSAKCTQRFLGRWKIQVKLFSSCLLALIIWNSISNASHKLAELNGTDVLGIFAVGVVLHLIYLFMNFGACKFLRFNVSDSKAVTIMGSQKTLNVALSVILFLPEALGAGGIMALPCIVCHFSQIFIDGIIAAKWSSILDHEEKEVEMI